MGARKSAISPIIATLLLILIAIAAGVIVYSYVVGFVGNSTTNSGATTDTLSIDQIGIAHGNTNFPVTVYVRNLGPTTESFNTGFYLKSATYNNQLALASSLTDTLTDSVTGVTYTAIAGNLRVTIASTCSAGGNIVITVSGVSSTPTACATVAGATGVTLNIPFITFTNSPSGTLGTITISSTPLSSAATVIGVTLSSGASFSIANGNVGELTLSVPAIASSAVPSNPVIAGTTYSLQVIGTDGGTTTSSTKAL